MDKDKEFDSIAEDIDSFCVNHDIDDYDLFGEIMSEDGNGSDFGSDIDFDY